tara:strand:+ start:6179 stop:7840 length:1662 start_codon:yes stop_codon:yes gene_type:complete
MVDQIQESMRQLSDDLNKLRSSVEMTATVYRTQTESINSLKTSIYSNSNNINNLSKALSKADESQRKATAAGISYGKFVSENSTQLKLTRAGFAETAAALVDGFTKGVNINNGAVFDLTEKMVATGQSTAKLNSLNANLISITGRDTDSVQRLAEINEEVSDKFLISNEKLIESLANLQESFDAFSVFEGGVGAFGELATELQGAAGAGAQRQVNTVLRLLEPSIGNVGKQFLGSLDTVRDQLAEGATVGLDGLKPFFERVITTFEQTGGPAFARTEVAAAQLGLSKQQFQASLQLARIMESGNKVQDEFKKAQEEEFKNMTNARQKANKFFDEVAPAIQTSVASITPAIIMAMQLQGGAAMGTQILDKISPGFAAKSKSLHAGLLKKGGIGGMATKIGGHAGGLGIAASFAANAIDDVFDATPGGGLDSATDILGGAGQGAAMGAMFGPLGALAGAGIGAGIGIFQAIQKNTKATQEELKKQREDQERKDREKRAAEAATIDSNFRIVAALASQAQDRMSADGRAMDARLEILNQKMTQLITDAKQAKQRNG